MPPRTGQLDELSQSIGRLEGLVEGIEKYIHDKRHDDANVSQKVDGLGIRITRDIAAVEGRIEGRIKAMDDRLVLLEQAKLREAGARHLAVWFLQSPLVGWIVAAILFAVAWWKKP